VKPLNINNYSIDAQKQVVFCDGKALGCVETAKKAGLVSKRTFGFFTWVYFYAVDLLSSHFSTFKKLQFSETTALANNTKYQK